MIMGRCEVGRRKEEGRKKLENGEREKRRLKLSLEVALAQRCVSGSLRVVGWPRAAIGYNAGLCARYSLLIPGQVHKTTVIVHTSEC
jgi:hypothetical protein